MVSSKGGGLGPYPEGENNEFRLATTNPILHRRIARTLGRELQRGKLRHRGQRMNDGIRQGVERLLDHLEMEQFNRGFEACLDAIDELSNLEWNKDRKATAETLRWAVKELKGENIEYLAENL